MIRIICITAICILCISSCKQTTEARINKAVRKHQNGKTQEAIAIYTDLINESPKLQLPYINRGYCYMETREYKKAYDDFNRIISLQTIGNFIFTLNPNSPVASEEARMQIDYDDAFYERAIAKIYLDSINGGHKDMRRLINKGYYKKGLCIMWQGITWVLADSTNKGCAIMENAKLHVNSKEDLEEINDNIMFYCN